MGSCVGKIFIRPSNPAGDSIVVVKDKLVVSESPPPLLLSSSSSNSLSVSSPFAFSISRSITKSLLSHSSSRVKPSTEQRPYTLKQRSPQREVARHEVERKENIRSRSLYGTTNWQRWKKKEMRMLRVHQILGESRIVSARILQLVEEELNNPLIFLECFIFL
ncbi:uncharacterized protein LOC122017615 [Zingiber officinale]|uniref:uncharacterized protein LOC122017615 n=1 Tax=Zingiber officinale TaxID=94328 RepID=UPI001C4BC310|nr:uncharacterized protein LOC122017615 [Zingiber officinale]